MVKPLVKLDLRSRLSVPHAGIRRAKPLILSNMRDGACLRVEKLKLYQKGENSKLKETEFFLSGSITRVGEEFYCEFQAHFGLHPPRSAHFAINEDNSRLQPLVQNGIPLEHAPLKLKPLANAETVELRILTSGSATIPGELYAVIMNTERKMQNGDDTNPTLPLVTSSPACRPSLELEQANALKQALKASPHPHLQMLGEIIEAKALDEKMIYLDRLVNLSADLRIVEAAAKFIGLYHPMMGLESLDLNDSVAAFLVVFHQQTPSHLLEADFTNALEKACSIQMSIWRSIAKSALLVLLQTEGGKLALLELANTYSLCGEKRVSELLEKMISWGKMKISKPTPEPFAPADNYLEVISGQNERDALQAAIEYLRFYGFIRITDLLD